MIFQESFLSLIITAVGAGIVSFISPCNAALLPTFISYIGSSAKNRRQSLLLSVIYAIGFTITFAIVGTIFLAGIMRLENRQVLNFISGAITILLAIYLFFNKEIQKSWKIMQSKRHNKKSPSTTESMHQLAISSDSNSIKAEIEEEHNQPSKFPMFKRGKYIGSFVLGFSTGSSWIACVTPVFATILAFGTVQQDYATAMYLMIFYGLGIMIPFIVVGILMGEINNRVIMKMVKIGSKIEKIFALVLVWMGIEIILSGFNITAILTFL